LALLVFRCQQALSGDGDRLTAQWGLTSAKWKVLGAIALAKEHPSAAAIGRAMGMTRQAAIKQIHLLLDQELLMRKANPTDARAPVHALTPEGRAAYEEVSAAWRRRSATLSSGARKADFAGACAVLERLLDRLERTPIATEEPIRRRATTGRQSPP
jgi:DNA-binding MarR family transcriptional regulator